MNIIKRLIKYICELLQISDGIVTKNNAYENIERYTITHYDSTIVEIINEHRKSIQLIELQLDGHLSDVSFTHTKYMCEKMKASHDGAVNRQNEYSGKMVLEIVGFGFSTPNGVFNAWMASELHKRAINDIGSRYIGISSTVDTAGKIYVTVLFLN